MTNNNWPTEEKLLIQGVILTSEYDYDPVFRNWLLKNYDLYKAFTEATFEVKKFEHKDRFSIYGIVHVVRYKTILSDQYDKTFKVGNNRLPDLARLIMEVNDELKGYFNIRGSAYRHDAIK